MDRFRSGGARLLVFACLWLLLGMAAACRKREGSRSRIPVIRIAQAQSRFMKPLTDALLKTLKEHYPAEIQSVPPRSLTNNARSVQEGDVELAIIPANVAYLAYTQGWADLRHPHTKLRGVAIIDTIPLHLVATAVSGIRKLSDIRGKHVAIGREGSTTEVTTQMILESLRLTTEDIHAEWIMGDAAVEKLREGKLDAVFNRGNDQEFAVGQVMMKLLSVPGARLIPILRDETENIRSTHPFLHPVSIPAGMYGDHSEVETIGVDSLMVCRDDLPEELVYWITRTLIESPAGVTRSYLNADQVHATPIPLHPGAARYYRERELFH